MSYNAPRATTAPTVTPEQILIGVPLLMFIIAHAYLSATGGLEYFKHL